MSLKSSGADPSPPNIEGRQNHAGSAQGGVLRRQRIDCRLSLVMSAQYFLTGFTGCRKTFPTFALYQGTRLRVPYVLSIDSGFSP